MVLLKGQALLEILDLERITGAATPDFLIIPGGSCDLAVIHSPLHALIREVNSRNGVLAGICNGAMVLASAGVLHGKSCTHTAHPKYAPLPQFQELLAAADQYFAGSTYLDEDVVCSDNVITAKPRAAMAFAEEVQRRIRQMS